jgi:addiction module HigA family antidote
MQAIVSGRAPQLTAQMAIRIATALGTTPEYWLDLQRAIELYDARKNIAASGKRPRPMAIELACA